MVSQVIGGISFIKGALLHGPPPPEIFSEIGSTPWGPGLGALRGPNLSNIVEGAPMNYVPIQETDAPVA